MDWFLYGKGLRHERVNAHSLSHAKIVSVQMVI